MDKLKSIYASAYSASITIVAVVMMTIGAELSVSFKNWLAQLTGHHWVTKSWASLLIFILLFLIFRFTGTSVDMRQTEKKLFMLEVVAILGFIAILGFYVYEFFIH